MMILSVTINSVLTSVSRSVAGMCLITESQYTLCRRCWLPGRRRGTECWCCVQQLPGAGRWHQCETLAKQTELSEYTRVYQHSRNTFQLMNITRCSLYSPGSACYRHHQADSSSLLVMNQQRQQMHIQHVLNWGISLLYSASAACSAA